MEVAESNLHLLFNEYTSVASTSNTLLMGTFVRSDVDSGIEDDLKEFDVFGIKIVSIIIRSQLDVSLEEPRVDWKQNPHLGISCVYIYIWSCQTEAYDDSDDDDEVIATDIEELATELGCHAN